MRRIRAGPRRLAGGSAEIRVRGVAGVRVPGLRLRSAADVDGEASRYVEVLGAELVWKVRGMGTTVACYAPVVPAVIPEIHASVVPAVIPGRTPIKINMPLTWSFLVGAGGFEPPASRL